jgi:hypothetical protein
VSYKQASEKTLDNSEIRSIITRQLVTLCARESDTFSRDITGDSICTTLPTARLKLQPNKVVFQVDAFKLLPQNFSNLLKSFLICATTLSPHDVVLALAFNHDTDWLPVTLQNLGQNVTDTIRHRIICMAQYRLKL